MLRKSLLILSLMFASLTAHAGLLTIDRSLGDVLNNPGFTQNDTGAQGIRFSDFTSAVDNSFFSLVLENAGARNANRMGLYLYNTQTEMQAGGVLSGFFEIFSGAQNVGEYTNLEVDFTSNIITRSRGSLLGGVPIPATTSTTYGGIGSSADFESDLFGQLADLNLGDLEIGVFLSSNNGDTYFSHNNLNAGGKRMVGIYDSPEYNGLAFAWEDRISGDDDYNDMVVFGTDLSRTEVPEPASLALFGMGAFGLMAMRRRKQVNA